MKREVGIEYDLKIMVVTIPIKRKITPPSLSFFQATKRASSKIKFGIRCMKRATK